MVKVIVAVVDVMNVDATRLIVGDVVSPPSVVVKLKSPEVVRLSEASLVLTRKW